MFCTVSVTRGSRSKLRGHARPSAVFSTASPSFTSTHTGTPCTDPSERRVATWQKFLACSSSSLRPSIVELIADDPFSRCLRGLDAHHDRAFLRASLLSAESCRGARRGDRIERREFAVVQLE